MKKKILLGLLSGFIAIQFIQPVQNTSKLILPTDIQKIYDSPGKIVAVLHNSCYDCHSNNTRYPWYSSIQPGAWLMGSHITEGKANLNFSEFGNYSNRKQQSKLQAIVNSINDNTMPINSYLILHRNAKLSAEDKIVLLNWINKIKDSLSLK